MKRSDLYNIAVVLLIVVPTFCGLAVLGGAILYATRPSISTQVNPITPPPVVRVAPTMPTIPTARVLTFEKLNGQGMNDFILINPDLAADSKQLEARARDYCNKNYGDFCFLYIWLDRAQAAHALPMTDAQVNTQVAQYKRNKHTGYDCFVMLNQGDMMEETMSSGCTIP